MSLGERVMINRDCWILTVSGQQQDNDVKLVIGSHAGIGMGATISAARQVVIGEHVLLARNVYISDHGHEFEDINHPIMKQGIRDIKAVMIGAHTWIGQNACILPGVTIGKHCVIGANSIVNSSIPDYCVAVGAPARVVSQYNRETDKWEKVKLVQKTL
jgi:acetyltransferase-like isoleucine patch superfamily enzyme